MKFNYCFKIDNKITNSGVCDAANVHDALKVSLNRLGLGRITGKTYLSDKDSLWFHPDNSQGFVEVNRVN